MGTRYRAGSTLLRLVLVLGVGLSLFAGLQPSPKAQAASIAHNSFHRTWSRTDQPVALNQASRTWMWGPASTDLIDEQYADSPGGYRVVQYFDKSRMEITNPNAVDDGLWYVTNGLLVMELVTGKLQIGNDAYEQRSPAQVNVAGDAGSGPTYAALNPLRGAAPLPAGTTISQRLHADGSVSEDGSLAGFGIRAGTHVVQTNHTIAQPFWDFMNSSGTVTESTGTLSAKLFQNPYYATGFPITEAYWARVTVSGTPKDVLLQCFERRCLTYTPDNPAGWQVEAGNVGLHYYQWRYGGGRQTPSPVGTDGRASMLGVSGNAFTWEPDWDAYAGALRDSNVGRARIELPWDFIQRGGRGTWDFGLHDQLVDGYTAQGLQPFGLLAYSASWARGDNNIFGPPEDLAAWESYVYETVKHYKGRIEYWEVWNEPDVAFFWGGKDGGDPAGYLELLKSAHSAAKRANPDAKIMNGGLTGTERGVNFMTQLLEMGAANYLDVIAFHGYVSPDGLDTDVYPYLIWPGISELHRRTGKPIWMTEFGWNASCKDGMGSCSEAEQANRVARNLAMLFAIDGMQTVSVFQFKDPNNADPDSNPHYYGLVRNNTQVKPAYLAVKTIADRLTGLTFERRVDYGDKGIWGMRFSGSGRSVEMLWSISGERDVTVSTGGHTNAFVHRMDGSWSYRRPNDGGIMVHLTRDPIIVEASS